mmetsp:Transcript_84430/g.133354  ORF Transcript_84430/g.133354 Transcript_84430/m.133354 type:complete len:203 (-) Transcript_84430:166-774(-)
MLTISAVCIAISLASRSNSSKVSPYLLACNFNSSCFLSVCLSFLMMSAMSLALASPFIRRIPSVNSLMVRDPSPSSKTFQVSINSISFISNNSSTCLTFVFPAPLFSQSYVVVSGFHILSNPTLWKNSSSESSPEPSRSSSKNKPASIFNSPLFLFSISLATLCLSSLTIANALSTMIAVTRFMTMNTPMQMNKIKNKANHP